MKILKQNFNLILRKCKIKISVHDMVQIAMILSLFLTAEYLNGIWNVNVFPGIKIQFTALVLILASLIFGSWKTGFAISIFVFLIAWTNPSKFLNGTVWVKGGSNIFAEYMLDYVIPLLSVSVIPGMFRLTKIKHFQFVTITIALFVKLMSHIFAGVLFWGSYAAGAFGVNWTGYIWSYSILANLLGMSFIIPVTFIVAWPSTQKLAPAINKHNHSL